MRFDRPTTKGSNFKVPRLLGGKGLRTNGPFQKTIFNETKRVRSLDTVERSKVNSLKIFQLISGFGLGINSYYEENGEGEASASVKKDTFQR